MTWERLRLSGPTFRPVDFIAQNPVFRLEEFVAAHRDMERSPRSAAEELKYHVETGRLVNLRRGLYAQATTWVDPWLIASRMAHDAVISHDGALSFHGVTGVGHRVTFITKTRTPAMTFNEIVFEPIRTIKLKWGDEVQRGAHRLKVTSLSITFVDCLMDLDRSPAPTELFELMVKSALSLDPQAMITYAIETKNRLVVSRLGFFLWCARYPLEHNQTVDLDFHGVRKPTYFQRNARTDQDSTIARWNLIVSPDLQLIVPRN